MKRLSIGLAVTLGMMVTAPGLYAAPQTKAKAKASVPKKAPVPKVVALTEDQKILHVLNRLGFGPRPGDVERVKALGLKSYLEQQLNPEKLKDDTVDAKTAVFESLKVTGAELAEMERNVQMNNVRLQRLQSDMAQRGARAGADAIQGAVTNAQTATQPRPGQQLQMAQEIYRNATPEERRQLDEGRMAREKVNQAGTQLVMNKLVRAAESEKQLYEVLVDFWSNHFNIDATKVRGAKVIDEQQVIRPHALGKFKDLLSASAHSAAMMLYLDNAQSVATQSTPARPQLQFTLEQVRQGAQRGFPQARQMLARLTDVAKTEGITEEEAYKRMQQRAPGAQRGGLNENYARELMELHTLGVDGGYTQKDVTEVARCLTGWGIRGNRYGGEFEFHAGLHDRGEKEVLGKKIPAGGGIEDGEKILELLATHPSTLRYISTKLCRRLVSDDPPKSLVDKCVATWQKTDGDIKEIVRTIVSSPEFFSSDAYKKKIKSPFEFVVSAVRATGATVEAISPSGPVPSPTFRPAGNGINLFAPNGNGQTNPRLLAGQIGTLGQPLFNYGFPTGYPEESSKWVSSGALIGRINFALSLMNGRLADVDMSKAMGVDGALDGKPLATQIDSVAQSLLGHALSSTTRATLLKQLEANKSSDIITTDETRRIAALVLGSPEFQRR